MFPDDNKKRVYIGNTFQKQIVYDKIKMNYLILYLEKAMAPHSSTLAWKIPGTEDPGRLQSMGSLRVGHHWATSLSLFTFMHWRRKWQPTPVFLPGESQGGGSLVGCRLWGRPELDTDWSNLAAAAAVSFTTNDFRVISTFYLFPGTYRSKPFSRKIERSHKDHLIYILVFCNWFFTDQDGSHKSALLISLWNVAS